MTTESVFQRASTDQAPLRVTLLFQDGSAFSYDETRETVGMFEPVDPIGLWRVPMDEDSFGWKLIMTMLDDSDLLNSLVSECGQVIAVQSQPREGATWP